MQQIINAISNSPAIAAAIATAKGQADKASCVVLLVILRGWHACFTFMPRDVLLF
jgi:hypothetical protein